MDCVIDLSLATREWFAIYAETRTYLRGEVERASVDSIRAYYVGHLLDLDVVAVYVSGSTFDITLGYDVFLSSVELIRLFSILAIYDGTRFGFGCVGSTTREREGYRCEDDVPTHHVLISLQRI